MQFQGIYWEKGALQGCYILFQKGKNSLSIGTEESDGPKILIKSNSYVYLYVSGADNPHDYYVIEDFDGPFKLHHSGDVFDYGDQRILLL